MILYGDKDEENRPVLQVAMPRAPRIYSPGGTMHVVARCNNREFYFGAQKDFQILLDHQTLHSSFKGGVCLVVIGTDGWVCGLGDVVS